MITPAYSPTATERVLPRLALDFTTASLDSRVTITRALNTATRINSSGYVEVVNANLPRFDYDPITLACKGLLIEETRENVSAEVNNWTTYAASLAPDVATSPAGTTTGDLFAESATTDTHLLYRAPTLSAVAYTFSVFYKIVGDRKLALYHTNTNTGRQFDATGVQSSGFFNAPSGGFAVTPMGNGWYRASITITAVAGANEFRFWIVRASDNALNYLGDGSSGAYLYGAQIEAGAFATSYIPTTTTSVTRNRDIVTMTGTNFSDWFNGSQGAFIGWFTTFASTGIRYIAAASASGAIADSLLMSVINAETDSYVNSGGVQQARLLTGTIAANVPAKLGLRYANANFAVAANGGGLVTQLSGSLPVGINQLNIGALSNSGFQLNGHMAKFFWYTSLTNAELVAFTK